MPKDSKEKVLIVEDEDDIRFLVKACLESKGYPVLEAYDGLSALDMAKSELPDVMLLDIMLPVYNGVEVCQRVKSDPATSGIKVIMMSALTHKELVDQAKSAGAIGYIEKPFDPASLEDRIRSIIIDNQFK